MAKILVHSGDLVLTSKIRASTDALGLEYISIKTNEDLSKHLTADEISTLIVDLNSKRLDVFLLLDKSVELGLISKTVCYYSHVDKELAAEAQKRGAQKIYRRSEFFSDIPKYIA